MKYFLFSLLVFFGSFHSAKAQMGQPLTCDVILKARFKKAKIKICDKQLDVDIADNDVLRSLGLMCRETMPENNGMIFIFDTERTLSFWMKNTKIPLSIGYIDKNKSLVDIFDMQPMDEKSISSTKPVLYALETNQGWFKKNNIKPGCKFDFLTEKTSSSASTAVTKVQ